jgi:hypothetical protein
MNEVLITGSSSGIGKHLTEYFLQNGDRVYGLARREQNSLPNSHFIPIKLDLSKPESIQAVFQNIDFSQLNTLILNAGIGYFSPFENIPPMKIHEIFNINTISPIIVTRLLMPILLKNNGRIVIISSISAEMISRWGSIYSSSKLALTHLGRQISEEFKNQNIKITIISPDIVNTEFYDNLSIGPSQNSDSYLETHDIVNAVDFVINKSKDIIISELKLKPTKFEIKKKKFQHLKTES